MGGGSPLVSLVLSVFNEDVCVAFSFEASMLYGRRHVKWNVSDQRVQVNCKLGMIS